MPIFFNETICHLKVTLETLWCKVSPESCFQIFFVASFPTRLSLTFHGDPVSPAFGYVLFKLDFQCSYLLWDNSSISGNVVNDSELLSSSACSEESEAWSPSSLNGFIMWSNDIKSARRSGETVSSALRLRSIVSEPTTVLGRSGCWGDIDDW